MAGKTKTFHPTITAKEILELFNTKPLLLTELSEDEMDMYHGIVTERLQNMEGMYKDLSKKYKEILKGIEKKFEPGHFNQLTLELGGKTLQYTVEERKTFKIKRRDAFKAKMIENKDPRGLTVSKAGVEKNLQYFKENYPEFIKDVYESKLGVEVQEEE